MKMSSFKNLLLVAFWFQDRSPLNNANFPIHELVSMVAAKMAVATVKVLFFMLQKINVLINYLLLLVVVLTDDVEESLHGFFLGNILGHALLAAV